MTASTITAQHWVPSTRRIERIWAKPHWHCYHTRGTESRRVCGADHRTEAYALECATKRAGVLNRKVARNHRMAQARAAVAPSPAVRKPADRHEALRDLEHAFALALYVMGCDDDETLRGATLRQIRCDLHALGVTSAELDKAGIKS